MKFDTRQKWVLVLASVASLMVALRGVVNLASFGVA